MKITWIMIFVITIIRNEAKNSYSAPNLPPSMAAIHKHHMREIYGEAETPNKIENDNLPHCYGFEDNCEASKRYRPGSPHSCSKREHWTFWTQGDFGYIRLQLDSLFPACSNGSSNLNCTRFMQLCVAKQLYLNLTDVVTRRWPSHTNDVFSRGQIGGDCNVDKEAIMQQRVAAKQLNGGLRSWFSELKEFSKIDGFTMNGTFCDVIVDKPVIFMKWDQGDNMYHRICDFLNLYMSQLLENSFSFNTDILIVSWNWTTRPYRDYFSDSLKAFTQNPVVNFQSWFGKRICISSATFSFLPRMILGLYYNSPLITVGLVFQESSYLNTFSPCSSGETCWSSGLIKSFSEFFLYRMKIKQEKPVDQIRVTFLVRKNYSTSRRTMYRRVLNQNELLEELENISKVQLQVVDFQPQTTSFVDQLTIISNTDIFISIHGAGLTHLLFLPDWAVVFELFDCEAKCYKDLARLRGIQHVTWEDQSKLTKHDNNNEINLRYYNYSFDRNEFKRLFLRAKSLLEKQNTITQHKEL